MWAQGEGHVPPARDSACWPAKHAPSVADVLTKLCRVLLAAQYRQGRAPEPTRDLHVRFVAHPAVAKAATGRRCCGSGIPPTIGKTAAARSSHFGPEVDKLGLPPTAIARVLAVLHVSMRHLMIWPSVEPRIRESFGHSGRAQRRLAAMVVASSATAWSSWLSARLP